MTEDAKTYVLPKIEGIDFSAPGMTKEVKQNGVECWYKDGKIVVSIYPDKSYEIFNDQEKPIKALQSDGTEVTINYDEKGNYVCSNSKGENWVNSPEGVHIYMNDGKGREIWYDYKGRISEEKIASGCRILYYDNGKKRSEEWDNGDFISYYDNGNIREQRKDGERGKLCKSYYYDGTPEFLLDKWGVKHSWYASGIEKIEERPDGSYKRWNEEGKLMWRGEVDREGNLLEYNSENKLVNKTFADGTRHYWNEMGRLEETFEDGTFLEWHPDGSLYYAKIPEVGIGKYYSHSEHIGRESSRELNGTSYSCDKVMAGNSEEIVQRYGLRQKSKNKEWKDGQGNLRVHTSYNGETFSYDEKGLITGVQYPDGVRTAFSYDISGKVHAQKFGKDGKLEHEFDYDYAKRGDNGDVYYCDCWDRLFSEHPDLAPKQTKTDVTTEHEVKSVQEPEAAPVEQQAEVQEPIVAPAVEPQPKGQQVTEAEEKRLTELRGIAKGASDIDTKAYKDFGEILNDGKLSDEEKNRHLDRLIEEEKQQQVEKLAELRGTAKGASDIDTKAYKDFGEILNDKKLSDKEKEWYLDGLIEEEKQEVEKLAELRGIAKKTPDNCCTKGQKVNGAVETEKAPAVGAVIATFCERT
ncbi:MAG: hypothetical protein E7004_04800 [Alphaproteobacteria bacterium]|nr:hypothetical protein [Alphaproteobacteria bacterium]